MTGGQSNQRRIIGRLAAIRHQHVVFKSDPRMSTGGRSHQRRFVFPWPEATNSPGNTLIA
jgi:hypothetical protein